MHRAIIGFLLLLGLQSLAHADSIYGTPAEGRWSPFSAQLPVCDDPGVLSTISGRFAQTQRQFWDPQLAIGDLTRVREIGFRANGLSYIPRRYCVARATMSDLKQRAVVYSIGQNLGIIGWSWGVEWCVVGLDPMLAYAPDCYVIKPIIERWLGQYKWLGEYGLRARY